MDVGEKQQYWMKLAEYDLETAKVMLDGGRYLYVGFMCHQVIEKALKGYYVATLLEDPPFLHNLTILDLQKKRRYLSCFPMNIRTSLIYLNR